MHPTNEIAKCRWVGIVRSEDKLMNVRQKQGIRRAVSMTIGLFEPTPAIFDCLCVRIGIYGIHERLRVIYGPVSVIVALDSPYAAVRSPLV